MIEYEVGNIYAPMFKPWSKYLIWVIANYQGRLDDSLGYVEFKLKHFNETGIEVFGQPARKIIFRNLEDATAFKLRWG